MMLIVKCYRRALAGAKNSVPLPTVRFVDVLLASGTLSFRQDLLGLCSSVFLALQC